MRSPRNPSGPWCAGWPAGSAAWLRPALLLEQRGCGHGAEQQARVIVAIVATDQAGVLTPQATRPQAPWLVSPRSPLRADELK